MVKIKATNIDINGKQRKLKDLVPGSCSFPFKYRRKMVYTCQPRKDGNWCATSVDNNSKIFKRQELIKYYLSDIIKETGSKGKTPEQTLSRCLQNLRDIGYIKFIDRGIYSI